MAAVDFLSVQDNVDADKIGVIGICGWGGMALNAAPDEWFTHLAIEVLGENVTNEQH